jgi:hypothetical protein
MGQGTVQQILQQGYTAFACHHPLPGSVRKAVWALLACRTARLGGHIQACPEGHVERSNLVIVSFPPVGNEADRVGPGVRPRAR